MRLPRSRVILPTITTFLALTVASLHAEDYAITTFAGVGLNQGSTDGTQGNTPNPTFTAPMAVAIDAGKNIYVVEVQGGNGRGGNTIRKITPGRQVTTLAGTADTFGSDNGTGAAARFNFPTGIAADSAGNLYVADSKNFMIRKVTPAGVVSTYAGAPFQLGSTNGPAASARFFLPYGVAVDSSGNVYVADGGNHLIRKITTDGNVSTLAGSPQQPGSSDGTGSVARFNTPWSLAVDGAGNVFVADSGSNTIRKITAGGTVTTIAGAAGLSGAVDGPGANARFNQPRGISVDAAGNVYVADYGNNTIRQINAAGIVTTIAGTALQQGTVDAVGLSARFFDPTGIVADGNVVYIADSSNNLVRRGQPASAATLPTITVQPLGQEIAVGQSVTLRVAASGSGLSYQWLKNGTPIDGATSSTFTITNANDSNYANYSVRVGVSSGGAVESQIASIAVVAVGSGPIQITTRPLSQQVDVNQPVTFSVVASGGGLSYQWLKNSTPISGATNANYTISSAQTGDAAIYTVRITGSGTTETATARLVVGVDSGPPFSISQQPVSRTVEPGQPATFFVGISGSSSVTYQWFKNDVAIGSTNNATFTIPAAQTSDQGTYKVQIAGSGLTLVSDPAVLTVGAPPPPPPPPPPATFSRLSNLSILTSLDAAGDSFTMGYVVRGGGDPKPILIRAAGPTLGAAPFSIPGVLADPKMELFAGSTKTSENDNWGGTAALSAAFTAVGAFSYVSPTSLDAAVLANISSADNSVKVSATSNGTGTVIAELYDSVPIANMTATSPRLVNVSVLKPLGAALTVGFVIDGNTSKKVLIRAVGPTIGTLFGVPGAVADPQLTLFSGQTAIGTNDNWGGGAELSAAFTAVGAFPLPATSRDAALIATLEPGAYTVRVTAVGATGTGLVEVYEMQ